MKPEHLELLQSLGFTRYESGCELMYAFERPAYAIDTGMLVQGDHATDYAELIYADEENFRGFCYAPSMLERLMMTYPYTHGVEKILRQIGRTTGVCAELAPVGIYPMIVIRCDDGDFACGNIRYYLSDMLKLIGMLDYHLQHRLAYLDKKERKKGL